MPISLETRFAFELPSFADVLLQFEAAAIPEQEILETHTRLSASDYCARVPAQDDIGERIWIRARGRFEVEYRARVNVRRQLADLATLRALDPHHLPGEAVHYLFDSRYCPADRFQSFVEAEFGGTSGGGRIAAIRDWIDQHLTYAAGSSSAATDAADTFIARCGICRDYAHLLVTLARASTIPARYVACYGPGVDPPDFHAVAEVFLEDPEVERGGSWQLVDATRMAEAGEIVKIGVGRDAADVSFLTSFGRSRFETSEIRVASE